jgi:hypothetical protein
LKTNFTSSQVSKDKLYKVTSFKSLSPQASKVQAHKIQRLQNSSSKPTKQWPTTTSLKAPKLKFKAHQAVAHNNKLEGSKAQVQSPPSRAHNNKLQGFKVQVQNPPSNGPQQQASRLQSSSSSPLKGSSQH